MNMISQFVVYPVWHSYYGDESYGNIVYIMSIINILAISLGTSINYIRVLESGKRTTHNPFYNRLLLLLSPVCGIICAIIPCFTISTITVMEGILIAVLTIFTMWRFYADVEYRLTLNYKGYCVYYLVIGAGYLLGCLLFRLTGLWPLALLVGEGLGLLMVLLRGSIFKKDPDTAPSLEDRKLYWDIFYLSCANLLSNLIFNGDRLLLRLLSGGAAVTTYYLASLLGKTMSLITTPLNSVVIGYLARYQGKIKKKAIWLLSLCALGVIAVATGVSVLASHILIPILYPENYASVKGYFLIGNLTQIIYFIGNVLLTVLLKIGTTNCQLTINIVYTIAFLLVCIPFTIFMGVDGFCIALFLVNTFRYLLCTVLSLYYCKE